MGHSIGLMEGSMLGNGLMESKMERETKLIIKDKLRKVNKEKIYLLCE